jgi:hypothetical protein
MCMNMYLGDSLQRVNVQGEIRNRSPSRGDAGPYFPAGCVSRLQRRAMEAAEAAVLNVSHTLTGLSQVAALQEVVRRCSHLRVLNASGNGLVDSDVFMLVEAFNSPLCHLEALDLSHNQLTATSVKELLPHCSGRVRPGVRQAGRMSFTGGARGSMRPSRPSLVAQKANVEEGPSAGGAILGASDASGGLFRRCVWPEALQLTHINLSGNPLGDRALQLLAEEVVRGSSRCALRTLMVRSVAQRQRSMSVLAAHALYTPKCCVKRA